MRGWSYWPCPSARGACWPSRSLARMRGCHSTLMGVTRRKSPIDFLNTIVLDDGKISIPQEVREALGLCPGTVLEVQSQAGTLVARKKIEPDVFEKWRGRGHLPAGTKADDYVRLIRDGDGR
jgi:bifunctional DNA-binding transcriptional regulator/antitoxin component of YhaV-PrlF toxin-antitoxin module